MLVPPCLFNSELIGLKYCRMDKINFTLYEETLVRTSCTFLRK